MKTVQIARSASKPVRRSSEPRRNLLPRRPSPTASSSSGSRTLVWRLRRRERRSSTEMGGGFRLGILLAHAGYAPAIAKLNSLTHLFQLFCFLDRGGKFASLPMNSQSCAGINVGARGERKTESEVRSKVSSRAFWVSLGLNRDGTWIISYSPHS
ncbi:hypothetical protein OPV22_010547 [Ensete ventricosum]|uniref:Uncharacterized protein n=1 Tax=Ensete ventricosum TaxID=4639 RepID=A0AAV8RDN2_ENSVE|nr:hypothetical protein OPV22_010547 [Ensete ventricosum]